MANRHRGEVDIVADGKTYTLLFSVNALCEIEAHFDLPIAQIGNKLNDEHTTRLADLRALLTFGLREHHPEMDFDEAGRIATAAGISAAMGSLARAFTLAFPGAGDGARPQKPKVAGSSRSRS